MVEDEDDNMKSAMIQLLPLSSNSGKNRRVVVLVLIVVVVVVVVIVVVLVYKLLPLFLYPTYFESFFDRA